MQVLLYHKKSPQKRGGFIFMAKELLVLFYAQGMLS